MAPLRVLIYACGTPGEIIAQQEQCLQLAEHLGEHEIVSLATDPPGRTTGWDSACAMRDDGEVDRVLVASRDLVPTLNGIESATREIRNPMRPGPGREEPPWRRRPRRLRDFKRRD